MAFRLFTRTHRISVLVAVAFATCITSTFAEGFRIETKVYSGDEKKNEKKNKEPISEATTLFLDGVVYDFLKKPEQTAVYRKSSGGKPGRFILLSDKYTIRTEFSSEKVNGTITKLRSWAARQRDPFLQFAANPEFDESFDSDNGKLILASHLENYTVTTTPADHEEALTEYREFLDAYTQLNTLLSGGKLPPGPRLRLNAALAQHRVLPQTVQLTRAGEDPLRAEHSFTWLLSQDDHKRIDNVRASLSSYKDVGNEEFQRKTTPKEKAK